jgi:hypothetical protein
MLAYGATSRCIPCNFSGSGVGSGFSCILNFFVKISDNFSSAAIMSSLMVANRTSGCGCFKASVISWAAMRMRSVEDI